MANEPRPVPDGARSFTLERGIVPRPIDLSIVLPQLPAELTQADEVVLQQRLCQETREVFGLMSKIPIPHIKVGRGDGQGPNDDVRSPYTYKQVYYSETGKVVPWERADGYEKKHANYAYGHHVDLGPVPMDEERVFDITMRAYDNNSADPAWVTGGEYVLRRPLSETEVPVTYLNHKTNTAYRKEITKKGAHEIPLSKDDLVTTLRFVMGAKGALLAARQKLAA